MAYSTACWQWIGCVSALPRVLILNQEKKKIVLTSSCWNEIIRYQGKCKWMCVSERGEKRGERIGKKKLSKIVFKFVYALAVLICFHP